MIWIEAFTWGLMLGLDILRFDTQIDIIDFAGFASPQHSEILTRRHVIDEHYCNITTFTFKTRKLNVKPWNSILSRSRALVVLARLRLSAPPRTLLPTSQS